MILAMRCSLFHYAVSHYTEAMSLNMDFFISNVVGVLAHLGIFIRGEWHLKAPAVLAIHLLLGLLTFVFEVRKLGFSLEPIINASILIVGYLFGLFSSIIAYRLSPFHRLSKFPGPRLAASTKFWHVWQCRDSRNHELMASLYKKYNTDFVRIGMITYANQGTRILLKLLFERLRAS